jgi:hypothetical protein
LAREPSLQIEMALQPTAEPRIGLIERGIVDGVNPGATQPAAAGEIAAL